MKTSQGARLRQLSLTALAGLLLAACGGGDPYTGLWLGSMNGNRTVSTMVLEDGEYYMLYSRPGNPASLGGLIHGSGDFHAAKVTSTDALEFSWEGRGTRPATLSGKVGGHMSLTGTVNNSTPITVRYDHEYEADPRLAEIVGSHTGEVMFIGGPRPNTTFTVTTTGQVSTTIDGCEVKGNVVPRADANAFDLTMKFGGAPCFIYFQQAEFKGIAYFRADVGQLHAAVMQNNRYLGPQAIGFLGRKQ
jgi:hypothetical protein